jgi:predicted nuclease of restriction endonuclease-like RecB superfamily
LLPGLENQGQAKGGVRVFQTELLSIRRNNSRGTVVPIFIGEDFFEYARLVRELFTGMIGSRRKDIADRLRELELKVQYNKVIKGIGEIMFRESRFSSTGTLDPSTIRERVFLSAPFGVRTQEERKKILQMIASEFSTTPEEVESSMYSDMEEEEILLEVSGSSDDELCRQYNLEQAETLLLKAFQLTVKDIKDWRGLARESKHLGLLFSPRIVENRIVEMTFDGPMSALEETRRYGVRFAQLLRYLISLDAWSFDCTVVLEKERKKEKFSFHLESSVSTYFSDRPGKIEILPDRRLIPADPILLGEEAFFPDYFLENDGKKIYIDVTRKIYQDYNEKIKQKLIQAGALVMFIYVLGPGDKPVSGEMCFRESVDWNTVMSRLVQNRTTENKVEPETKTKKVNKDSLRLRVDKLWPDLDRMFREIEESGLDLIDTLREFGYSTKWEGLNLKIVKNT